MMAKKVAAKKPAKKKLNGIQVVNGRYEVQVNFGSYLSKRKAVMVRNKILAFRDSLGAGDRKRKMQAHRSAA
jgi:hypothetical protein